MIRSSALVAVMLMSAACDCGDRGSPASPDAPQTSATRATSQPTRETAERAVTWLEQQVRVPAGDPQSPWALAHGLLAFGRDFSTSDGRSAVEVVASFAELQSGEAGHPGRYRFAVERAGKPVEPHPHLLVKTFLEIGLDPATPLRVMDGVTIDVRRLLTDMRAVVGVPEADGPWHDSAWWLAALILDATTDATEVARLSDAAVTRLEADNVVISASAPNVFTPDSAIGAAKRNKTHIYGHACGGLHFTQAVFRAVGRNASPDSIARAGQQLRLLLARYQAERDLYTDILRSHPKSLLPISGQQLKFFGHVLETLAVADEVGLLRHDVALATAVQAARRQLTADVILVVAQLKQTGAYTRLPELSVQQHQLFLDLIGDGCHAIHGLRVTLPVLPTL